MKTINFIVNILAIIIIVGCNERKEEIVDDSKYFKKDSLSAVSLTQKKTFKQNEISDLVSLYTKISQYSSRFDSSKAVLLRKFHPIKITVEVGTIYFDEFSEEFIKSNLKNITLAFQEYFPFINSDKYVPKRIYSGYKNSLNKKAHNLYKKYSWPKEDCLTVAGGRIRIGMNKDMVIASWGRPHDINRTTYSFGVHEQWVYGEYGSSYVYFEDGKVTTIQN
jgi:hypothetical protein